MNWDDLRFVLALAKGGSLSRAARELAVDHSTVGRRIEALETDLGVRLFTRTTSGYVVTPEAAELLPEIRRVESAVLALERAVHARDEGLRGTVRITAGDVFGSRYLAARLAPLSRRHPELTIELILGSNIFDLGRREADVGVRLFRTNLDHLAVRRAGELTYALYASEEYLRRRPPPRDPGELGAHDMILDDVDQPRSPESLWIERLAGDARVTFASNSTAAVLAAAVSGLGVALIPRFLGDAEPTLRYLPMPDEPVRGIWLTVHKDLRETPRVRAVLDYLGEVIAGDAALLGGKPSEGGAG
jgi:DNA-binding transcriptional LysR family regulator